MSESKIVVERIIRDNTRLWQLEQAGTRWHELFGTPERAARTLESIPCGNSPCSECPIFEPCLKGRTKSNALLEWLNGDGRQDEMQE